MTKEVPYTNKNIDRCSCNYKTVAKAINTKTSYKILYSDDDAKAPIRGYQQICLVCNYCDHIFSDYCRLAQTYYVTGNLECIG